MDWSMIVHNTGPRSAVKGYTMGRGAYWPKVLGLGRALTGTRVGMY